jgi:hypothetical protein
VHRNICCEQSTLWRLPASVPVHAHRMVFPIVARVVQERAVGSTLGQLMQKSGWDPLRIEVPKRCTAELGRLPGRRGAWLRTRFGRE